MPEFSSIRSRDLLKLLKKNGFEEHTREGSHCTLKNINTGKRTTIPVHPGKTIGKGLLNAILKQAGLDKSILKDI